MPRELARGQQQSSWAGVPKALEGKACSELLLGEATTVVVVDPIPALRVAVRPELCVAAVRITEAFRPALLIAHDHDLCARRVAGLVRRDPALTLLPARIPGAEPALLLALLGAPDPELTLWQREADLRARLDLARHELV